MQLINSQKLKYSSTSTSAIGYLKTQEIVNTNSVKILCY